MEVGSGTYMILCCYVGIKCKTFIAQRYVKASTVDNTGSKFVLLDHLCIFFLGSSISEIFLKMFLKNGIDQYFFGVLNVKKPSSCSLRKRRYS